MVLFCYNAANVLTHKRHINIRLGLIILNIISFICRPYKQSVYTFTFGTHCRHPVDTSRMTGASRNNCSDKFLGTGSATYSTSSVRLRCRCARHVSTRLGVPANIKSSMLKGFPINRRNTPTLLVLCLSFFIIFAFSQRFSVTTISATSPSWLSFTTRL